MKGLKLGYVIDRFSLLSGVTGEELSKWVPVCMEAMEEIKAMATAEALEKEASAKRLAALSGVLAYYKYTLYSGENIKSITAGTVSITNFQDERVRAEALFEREKSELCALLDSSKDFCFKRVTA